MNWREYILLSHAETHNFSLRRSIVGIVLIVMVCLVAGIISLLVNGKLETCTATFQEDFEKAQVGEKGAGCKGATVSVGQLLYGKNFTYVATTGIDNYQNEMLQCYYDSGSATINVVSFAAPQFVWDYDISCYRPATCCPKNSPRGACPCLEPLELNIQDFSWTYNNTQQQLLNLTATNSSGAPNYSSVNDIISSLMVQTCPGGERIIVLRFDDHSYSAFNSSGVCSGQGGSNSTLTDYKIALAIYQIRNSIYTSIANDLKNFTLPFMNYECFYCSPTHNIGELLLNLLVAISALGSITYSIVIWLLKVTQQENPSSVILEMPII